jgi:triacylglycerol lipase
VDLPRGTYYGTTTADVCSSTACKEIWPGSSFITALNSGHDSPGVPRYATGRSPCDEVIVPARNAQLLDGVANTETRCIKHSQLHEGAGVYTQVREWARPMAAAPAPVLASASPW